jgi:hypothetical protein
MPKVTYYSPKRTGCSPKRTLTKTHATALARTKGNAYSFFKRAARTNAENIMTKRIMPNMISGILKIGSSW